MRTTLTIEDSIAVRIEALRAERHMTFKETINHLLSLGLDAWEDPGARTEPQQSWTRPRSFGRQLVPYDASTADMLAILEGEDHK
jgi:hypothetical protein